MLRVNNVILEPSLCTDVAAKVHNQYTLTGLVPKHPNTVVFDCQLPEDFRNQMTSNERSVGVCLWLDITVVDKVYLGLVLTTRIY